MSAVVHYAPAGSTRAACGAVGGAVTSAAADVTCAKCRTKLGGDQKPQPFTGN